ncbi:MAG: glycine/betaine/sarcosine/D-proline family reductase selenoprotein B [Nitrospirae bacterium]|nr:glycine/betaine/sarcosine/D-proline family reductase selenoprotein B [Nitrospirota bacterium]
MTEVSRIKNRLIARLATRFPFVQKFFVGRYEPQESEGIPWTPVEKLLSSSGIAVVTTAGVHRRNQPPFDMKDPNGDASFRIIDGKRPVSDLMITHDYYDHRDADLDINIVFPIERLREFEHEGIIGKVADKHYGFMGHILGPRLRELIGKTAPEVAGLLKADGVDAVLLTPG